MKFFKNKATRKAILITLLIMFIYEIGTYLTIPGINQNILFNLSSYMGNGDAFSFFLNGKLNIMSLFALGVIPYITASIIIQLLEMDIVPFMAEWKEMGEKGRKRRNEVIRIFALCLAYVEALGIVFALNVMTGGYLLDLSTSYYFLLPLVIVAGTAILLWLADIITVYGVGNGVSVLIMTRVLTTSVKTMVNLYNGYINGQTGLVLASNVSLLLATAVIFLVIVIAIIYFVEGKRNIPINYVGQSSSPRGKSSNRNFLPIKINAAGVIPVIFAATIMKFPQLLASIVGNINDPNQQFVDFIDKLFNYSNGGIALLLYCLLVFAFSLLYSFIQINPEKLSENLEKQNAYIAGIRPGSDTADYIEGVLYRLTFWGGIMLAVIAASPIIFANLTGLPSSLNIGGTGIIIVTGVILQIINQMKTKIEKTEYRGFL